MSLESRFWSKVEKRGPGECWEWTGAKNEHGYGVMRPEGRRHGPTIKAHRVALILAGRDVEGLVACHRCDNPPCVNPAHLFLGTQKQNVADMHAKGRGNHGTRNGASKLSEPDIALIRAWSALRLPRRPVMDGYGIAPNTYNNVAKGKTWRHVQPSPALAYLLAVAVLRAAAGIVERQLGVAA